MVASITFTSIAQEIKLPITFSGTFIPKDRAAAYVVVYGNIGQEGIYESNQKVLKEKINTFLIYFPPLVTLNHELITLYSRSLHSAFI